MDEFEDNVKKILCCSSLVSDLVTAKAIANPKKLRELMLSEEAKHFIESAQKFSDLLNKLG